MKKDLNKMCRVCMADGTRNLFQTSQIPTSTNLISENLAYSPERLLEKLRYVSLIKINEYDNLPKLLCDLCIIQLNVAYNFKQQIIDTDTKLRQFIIENDVSTLQKNPIISSGTETTAPIMTQPLVTSTQYLSTIQYQKEKICRRQSMHVPFQIKSEPSDFEAMSDITIDTNNTETECPNTNCRTSTPLSNIVNDNATPSPYSMVKLSDNHLLSTATSSDSEFIKHYLQPSLAYSSIEPVALPHGNKGAQITPLTESSLIIANTKSTKQNQSNLIDNENEEEKSTFTTSLNSTSKPKKINRELRSINRIDFNFIQKDIPKVGFAYPLRNKFDRQKKPKIQRTIRQHHRVLNPANRMRIKQEQSTELNNGNSNNDFGKLKIILPHKLQNELSETTVIKEQLLLKRSSIHKRKVQTDRGKQKKQIQIRVKDLFSADTSNNITMSNLNNTAPN